MKKGLTRRALTAGVAFAITMSGMAYAPAARAETVTTGTSTTDDSDIVYINDGQSEFTSQIVAPTVSANAASAATNLSVQQKQSDIDALAAGVNTDSGNSGNGVLIAAVVAAIAGFAGAAAIVGNFFTADKR